MPPPRPTRLSTGVSSSSACVSGNAYSITIVPLYDTLGAESTAFILSQTRLRTVVASQECAERLLASIEQHSASGGVVASPCGEETGTPDPATASATTKSEGEAKKTVTGKSVKGGENKSDDKKEDKKTGAVSSSADTGEKKETIFQEGKGDNKKGLPGETTPGDGNEKEEEDNTNKIYVKYLVLLEDSALPNKKLVEKASSLGIQVLTWSELLQKVLLTRSKASWPGAHFGCVYPHMHTYSKLHACIQTCRVS